MNCCGHLGNAGYIYLEVCSAALACFLPVREDDPLTPTSGHHIFPLGKDFMMRDQTARIITASQFGSAVARARKKLGITQRELALAINTGERFIVELEAGKPTAQLGKALAAARGVGIRLIDGDEKLDDEISVERSASA